MSPEPEIHSTGIKVEAVGKYQAPTPPKEPGKHMWIVLGSWRVEPEGWTAAGRVHLDMENLISIDGPGCYWCEEQYSPEIATKPCRGYGK